MSRMYEINRTEVAVSWEAVRRADGGAGSDGVTIEQVSANLDDEEIERISGTPQGGVVSPVLSNLFLHEAFDKWMQEIHPLIQIERYADDLLIHCTSDDFALSIKDKIEERLKQYKLELHSEKTRIVYTGKSNKHDGRGHWLSRKFTFLGYDFKPREYKGSTVFTPGMGQSALKVINRKLKSYRLVSLTHRSIEEIAQVLNPKLRGWINYYGHCRRSELYRLADLVNQRLAKWLNKKHKIRLYGKSWDALKQLKHGQPTLFVHWYMIAQPSTRRAV
jgi:RNA-directed DNA polymerase